MNRGHDANEIGESLVAFAQIATEMTERIRWLGPNHLRKRTEEDKENNGHQEQIKERK